jgi:hypothetical protein
MRDPKVGARVINALLPPEDDITSIVLRGHLAIEEQLDSIIKSSLQHPEALKNARLNFYQHSLLAKALKYHDENRWVWDAIESLNKVRNNLAHELEAPKLTNALEAFLACIEPHVEPFMPRMFQTRQKDVKSRLTSAITILAAVLESRLVRG